MVSSEATAEVFSNLSKDIENQKCVECRSPNPGFASVNHGCFICQQCVHSHLLLGQSISRVKSIEEQWSAEDLKMMSAGGNSALIEFFKHYNLLESPPSTKYCTKAAFFYRDMLEVVALDQIFEKNCPDISEGSEIIVSLYPEILNVRDFGIEENKLNQPLLDQPQQKKKPWDIVRSAYFKTVTVGNKAMDKLSEKVNKFAEKPGVKKAEDKTKEIFCKIESKLSSFIDKVYSKPIVQSTVSEMNNAADAFTREVKFTYTKINSNPSVNRLKANTMSLLRDLGIAQPENPDLPQERSENDLMAMNDAEPRPMDYPVHVELAERQYEPPQYVEPHDALIDLDS